MTHNCRSAEILANGFRVLASATASAAYTSESDESRRHVQGLPEPASQLTQERDQATDNVSRHFLGQLPNHCHLLLAAIIDASEGLARLDPEVPYSTIVLARGLLEAAADMYWLSDTSITSRERVRRTCVIYLQQIETQIRRMEDFQRRHGSVASQIGITDEAVGEGYALLRTSMDDLAAVGYQVKHRPKKWPRYIIEEQKPTISELVDTAVCHLYGKTGSNVYSLHSAVAHVDGCGLDVLRIDTDAVETAAGIRHRYGLTSASWTKLAAPSLSSGAGAVDSWLHLAYPSRNTQFREQMKTALRQPPPEREAAP